MEKILKLIGCDSRWMAVWVGPDDARPALVRHYLGKPSWGWEYYEMDGPFPNEQAVQDYLVQFHSKH